MVPGDRLLSIHRGGRAARTVAYLFGAFAISGCSTTEQRAEAPHALSLTARTELRVIVDRVGMDTLSDSARVLSVVPEADADAIPFVFADPVRHLTGGLGITQREHPGVELIWPDSVVAIWWPVPHSVAFATSDNGGLHVVGDVHAQRTTVVRDTSANARPVLKRASPAVSLRARMFVDSLRVQPTGRPQGSTLRYRVDTVMLSSSGRRASFHVEASDDSGHRQNPAWYVLDVGSGAVAMVDEVVGPVSEMSASAGGWAGDDSFVYAKGRAIWQATIRSTP